MFSSIQTILASNLEFYLLWIFSSFPRYTYIIWGILSSYPFLCLGSCTLMCCLRAIPCESRQETHFPHHFLREKKLLKAFLDVQKFKREYNTTYHTIFHSPQFSLLSHHHDPSQNLKGSVNTSPSIREDSFLPCPIQKLTFYFKNLL